MVRAASIACSRLRVALAPSLAASWVVYCSAVRCCSLPVWRDSKVSVMAKPSSTIKLTSSSSRVRRDMVFLRLITGHS